MERSNFRILQWRRVFKRTYTYKRLKEDFYKQNSNFRKHRPQEMKQQTLDPTSDLLHRSAYQRWGWCASCKRYCLFWPSYLLQTMRGFLLLTVWLRTNILLWSGESACIVKEISLSTAHWSNCDCWRARDSHENARMKMPVWKCTCGGARSSN